LSSTRTFGFFGLGFVSLGLMSASFAEEIAPKLGIDPPAGWTKVAVDPKSAAVRVASFLAPNGCVVQINREECNTADSCSEVTVDTTGLLNRTKQPAGEKNVFAAVGAAAVRFNDCDDAQPVGAPTAKFARTVTQCSSPKAVADVGSFQFKQGKNQTTVIDAVLLCKAESYATAKPDFDRLLKSVTFAGKPGSTQR
jgi:hypothetical protein